MFVINFLNIKRVVKGSCVNFNFNKSNLYLENKIFFKIKKFILYLELIEIKNTYFAFKRKFGKKFINNI